MEARTVPGNTMPSDGKSDLPSKSNEKSELPALKFEPICEQITSSRQKTFIECCEFTADGRVLVLCGADGFIRFIDMETKTRRELKGHDDVVWGIAISPDDKLLCSCSTDKSVKVWQIESLELIATFSGHADTVWGAKFTKDCDYIISCSSDLKIIVWDVKSQRIHRVMLGHGNVVENISLSPSGKILVSCSRDHTLRVWENFLEKDEIDPIILRGHKRRVTYCSFPTHRNDIFASTSADCMIILWSVAERRILHTLAGHFNVVWSCSFLRMKSKLFLVSCSSDHSLM